jgi:hypothetical protein
MQAVQQMACLAAKTGEYASVYVYVNMHMRAVINWQLNGRVQKGAKLLLSMIDLTPHLWGRSTSYDMIYNSSPTPLHAATVNQAHTTFTVPKVYL